MSKIGGDGVWEKLLPTTRTLLLFISLIREVTEDLKEWLQGREFIF